MDQDADTGGRRERFESLYRRYVEPVLLYALRRAQAEIARDAVADTFLAAWRRLDELPEDPLPWLIGTTRKTLANQRRSTARQARLAERLAFERRETTHELDPWPGDPVVRSAFRRLSVSDREVLALVAWDELTPAQASRSLQCSPVVFRVRLHRARRRFERALEVEAELDRDGVGLVDLAMREAS